MLKKSLKKHVFQVGKKPKASVNKCMCLLPNGLLDNLEEFFQLTFLVEKQFK